MQAATIDISVNPPTINFGSVIIGQFTDQTITITNQATSDATLTGSVGTLSAPFSVQSGGGPFSLTPGQSFTVTVRFSPTTDGAAATNLYIIHNATNQTNPTSIPLIGTGVFIPTQYIYVDHYGLCGGKNVCFSSIQDGIDSAQSFTIIEITQETYYEDVIFDDPKVITLQGGWDTNFTSSSSYTTINGSIMITNGTMIIEYITVSGVPNCTSTVTATLTNPAGGSITSTNPYPASCCAPVTFSGTLVSGGSITSVSEGTYTSNGLTWQWTGITAPTTNDGNKTVTITFSGDMDAQWKAATSLNTPSGDSDWYGIYDPSGYYKKFSVQSGNDYWVSMNPADLGKSFTWIKYMIWGLEQGYNMELTVYVLDKNNNKVASAVIGNGDNGQISGSAQVQDQTLRYLWKIHSYMTGCLSRLEWKVE